MRWRWVPVGLFVHGCSLPAAEVRQTGAGGVIEPGRGGSDAVGSDASATPSDGGPGASGTSAASDEGQPVVGGGTRGGSGDESAGGGGGGPSDGGSSDAPTSSDDREPVDAGARPHPSDVSGARDADTGAEDDTQVRGRVIDRLGRPLAAVPVTIGATTVETDDEGSFSIAEVGARYDASLIVRPTVNGFLERHGYAYEGLTRRDPTLQVFSALPEREAASLVINVDNTDMDVDERLVLFAYSGPDGHYVSEVTSFQSTSFFEPGWSGPDSTTGWAHALALLVDQTSAGRRPLSYEAHQGFPVAFQNAVSASITFDLAPAPIPITTISGSVSGGPFNERRNTVSLRFDDGTVLPIIEDPSPSGTFSYNVPNLPNTSLVMLAKDGVFDPETFVHRDGIAPGEQGITLAIPSPVDLDQPFADATVTANAIFSWSAPAAAATFVWHLEFSNQPDALYVVTARTQIQLPEIAAAFPVAAGNSARWLVQTHGDAADVDALAGPAGFIDAFALRQTYPIGPRRGAGSFTKSAERYLTFGGAED